MQQMYVTLRLRNDCNKTALNWGKLMNKLSIILELWFLVTAHNSKLTLVRSLLHDK